MKNFKVSVLAFAIAFGVATLHGCKKETLDQSGQNDVPALIKKARPSNGNIIVAGGGTTEEFGFKTTYEFNAVQSAGKTTGHIILKFRAAGGSLYVKVDCLRLFDGNKATLSGVITQLRAHPHSNPDFPVPPFIFIGGRVSLTVQDNGEGGASASDMVSDLGELIPGVPASCADVWPVYLPIDGNTQIIK